MSAEKKIIKCFVYARVSTDEQTSGQYNSVESQIDICKHYIEIQKEKGWQFIAPYTDPGFSGKNLDRPGMQHLISDIKQGKIDVIIVYKIERLVRSIKDFYQLWDLFETHNVTFVSATQQFDSSNAMGKLMLNVLLSFAQFERENTSEKTRDKMKQRARLGKWHGGLFPFGYDYNKETKKLVINKNEALAVKKSFSLFIEGRNATEIANYLNAKGFRTKARPIVTKEGVKKTQGENYFNDDFIKKLISNPIYKGFVRFNGEQFKGEHDGLVSVAIWEKANQLIKPVVPQKVQLTKDNHVHLLKGLLRCGECGTFLTPYPAGKKDKNGNPYLYYACGRVVDFGTNSNCRVRLIPAREFENVIKKCLTDLGNNKALIESTIKNSTKMNKSKIKPLQNEKEKNETLLGKTTAEINRIIKILKSQDLVGNEITEEYKKLLSQKSSLQNDLEKLTINIERCNQDILDAEMIKKTLSAFDKVIISLSLEDQKDLFNLLIKEITIWGFDPDKEKAPNELGAFTAKVRTKWLRIKLSLYQFPQIETYYKSLAEKKASSDSTTKWLPGRDTQRTIHRLTIHIPIHLMYNGSNALEILEGAAPYGISTVDRITKAILRHHKPINCKLNPIKIALKYQQLYEQTGSMTVIGQQLSVSRARIHQMLNLLKLDQRIIDYLINITDPKQINYWTEHRLRTFISLSKEEQYKNFIELLRK